MGRERSHAAGRLEMRSASPPGNADRRPGEGRRIGELTGQVLVDSTRARRQDALRRALKDARRRRDADSIALLVRWLSDEAAA